MRQIFPLLAIASLVLCFSACKKSNNSPSTASVMYVNGCAGTTNINASLNGAAVSNAQNLGFLRNTGYLSATAGNDNITFVLSSVGATLTTGSGTFVAGNNYSVYAGGMITSPLFVATQDDLSAPASGNAKIRIVNLSPDKLSITADVGTIAIDSAIASGGYSGFMQVAAGTYVVKAGAPSNISTVVSAASQQFSSGRIYTVLYTGNSTGTGISAYTATVINNN